MDDEYEPTRPSRVLRWQNVAAVVLSGTSSALEQVADTMEAIAHLLMADGNYADDRTSFHEEAAMELETLLEENE
jgi:hypothetical protein